MKMTWILRRRWGLRCGSVLGVAALIKVRNIPLSLVRRWVSVSCRAAGRQLAPAVCPVLALSTPVAPWNIVPGAGWRAGAVLSSLGGFSRWPSDGVAQCWLARRALPNVALRTPIGGAVGALVLAPTWTVGSGDGSGGYCCLHAFCALYS